MKKLLLVFLVAPFLVGCSGVDQAPVNHEEPEHEKDTTIEETITVPTKDYSNDVLFATEHVCLALKQTFEDYSSETIATREQEIAQAYGFTTVEEAAAKIITLRDDEVFKADLTESLSFSCADIIEAGTGDPGEIVDAYLELISLSD